VKTLLASYLFLSSKLVRCCDCKFSDRVIKNIQLKRRQSIYIYRVGFGAAICVVSLTPTSFDFCRSIDVSYNTKNVFHRNIPGCPLVSLRRTSSPFWQVVPLCPWSLLSQFAFQIPWISVHFAKSHTAHPTARTERKSLNPVFSLSLRLITHC
jgi:hypothetical protein